MVNAVANHDGQACAFWRRAALLALLIAIGAAGSAAAQTAQPPTHRGADTARWFAPILWPAIYETGRPTLPHALAFDGLDNNCDGRKDLEDPIEAAFGHDVKAFLSQLRLASTRGPALYGEPGPECSSRTGLGAAWQVQEGKDVERLASAFATMKVKPPRRVLFTGPAPFRQGNGQSDVLEYWFYYFYDQGPGGHVNDAEHAFLFLDVANRTASIGEIARYDATESEEGTTAAIRVVVGAAHEGSTSNNILATTRQIHRSRVVPTRLPTHLPFLVELGKHASAPDLRLDGRFDAGFDANMFRGSMWGLRDSLAAGLNEVGAMTFEPWQSFPRRPADISVERSFFDGPDALKKTYTTVPEAMKAAQLSNSYTLFPMEDLETLHELLAEAAPKEQIEQFLKLHQRCFWGEEEWSGTIAPEVYALMREWPKTKKGKAHRPWQHEDHLRPLEIFKLHLFPRLAFNAGFTGDTGGDPLVKRLGLEISDIKWWSVDNGFFALFFPGRLLSDSRLEASFGSKGGANRWAFQDYSVTWKKGRGNRGGVYVGVQGRKAKVLDGVLQGPETLDRVSFETGISIERLKERLGGSEWIEGARAGIFIGHSFARLGPLLPSGYRVEGQFGIVVEPQAPPSDVEESLGALPNIRAQWGVTFSWNSARPQTKPWMQ
jgi:hypothetical protein